MIKYGVIERARLEADLRGWESLYVSGRMHKPVCILQPHHGIAEANRVNLRSALAAALLLMPEEVGEVELYRCICQLSYRGDIRMLFAEDRYKVGPLSKHMNRNPEKRGAHSSGGQDCGQQLSKIACSLRPAYPAAGG